MKRSLVIAILAIITIFSLCLAPGSADAQTYRVQTCADCHTYPPVDAVGTRGTPTGAVIGSHGKHALSSGTNYGQACTVCHIDNGTNLRHRDGNIDMIANIQGGSYSLGSVTQRNILTGTNLGTCSSVACHANGVTTATVYATPQWGNAATGACGTCHGVTASNPP